MVDTVLLERKDGVLELTLNRPEALNALDLEMAEALCRQVGAALAAASDGSVRAVLLKAEGKYFCAGGDVGFFTGAVTAAPAEGQAAFARLIDNVHAVIERIVTLPVPVVAAVQGGAAGFGLSLMAACDVVVAGEGSVYTMAYMNLGATPDGGATWLLPRLLGLRQARRLILLSERFGVEEALRTGLVDQVVAPAQVLAEAGALAARLAQGPTQAQGRLKALLASSYQRSLSEQLAAEKNSFLACAGTADFAEGIRAFGERRPAGFKGC